MKSPSVKDPRGSDFVWRKSATPIIVVRGSLKNAFFKTRQNECFNANSDKDKS